jgi:serine O-acetyltransferase
MPYAPPPESADKPIDPARLAESTRHLLESIHADPRTRHVSSTLLPDRGRVIEALDKLHWLLFPGFFGPRAPGSPGSPGSSATPAPGSSGPAATSANSHAWIDLDAHLQKLLSDVSEILFEQITAALRYARDVDHTSGGGGGGGKDSNEVRAQCETRARATLASFASRLPAVRRLLSLDVQAAYDGDPAAHHTDEVIFCYPGMRALSTHRLAHELYRLSVPLIPRMMAEHAHSQTGIDIHPGARIGKSFFIDHGTGVVIGETTVIGDHCRIYQGVTLGAKSFPKDEQGKLIRSAKRHPTLEDHVTVFAGATILGGDTTIGAGSVINGGVFLTNSVPPGHIVRAPKAELTMRNNPDLPPGSWQI